MERVTPPDLCESCGKCAPDEYSSTLHMWVCPPCWDEEAEAWQEAFAEETDA